jgi:hypothetical protein
VTPLVALSLFLPLLLSMELAMAAQGRDSVRDAMKRGVRNFGRHTVLLLLGVLAFHFVTGWFASRPPL